MTCFPWSTWQVTSRAPSINETLGQDNKFTADEVKMALVAAKDCMQGTTECTCTYGKGRKYPHTYHDGEKWFPPLFFQPYEMPLQHYEAYCDEAPGKYRVILDPIKGTYVGTIVHTDHGNAFTCCYNLKGSGDFDCSCIRRPNGECP